VASRSRIRSIRDTCHEARTEVDNLRLDYFLVSNRLQYEETNTKAFAVRGTTKNYINIDLDTVWFSHLKEELYYTPGDILWVCGKCEVISPWNKESCQQDPRNCLSSAHDSFIYIKRLAVNYSAFLEPDGNRDYGENSFEMLVNNHVKELILVVGEYEYLSMARDVVFVTPSSPVYSLLKDFKRLGGIDHRDTWAQAGAYLETSMLKYKNKRAVDREAYIRGNYISLQSLTFAQFLLTY